MTLLFQKQTLKQNKHWNCVIKSSILTFLWSHTLDKVYRSESYLKKNNIDSVLTTISFYYNKFAFISDNKSKYSTYSYFSSSPHVLHCLQWGCFERLPHLNPLVSVISTVNLQTCNMQKCSYFYQEQIYCSPIIYIQSNVYKRKSRLRILSYTILYKEVIWVLKRCFVMW